MSFPHAGLKVGMRALSAPDAAALARELGRVGLPDAEANSLAERGIVRVLRAKIPAGIVFPAAGIFRAYGVNMVSEQGIVDFQPPSQVAGDLMGDAFWRARDGEKFLSVIIVGTEEKLRQAAATLCDEKGMAIVGEAITETLLTLSGQPRALKCGRFTLPLGAKTYVMGILNVTPDSFSGDGLLDIEGILKRAEGMIAEGADILDVGGESTRPGAEPVSLEEELRRVVPVVRELAARFDVPISVDTYSSEVARAALKAGASIVNDISGLRFDAGMARVVAEAGASVVVMHIQGTPRTMQQQPHYDDLMTEICDYLAESTGIALEAGIPREQIVLDPGFGFGKLPEHNLEILRRLRELTSFGQPVLIGTSRKGTIGKILGDLPPDERLEGTAATVAVGIANGADIIRVHDVKSMSRVARMTDAIIRLARQ